MKIAIIITEPHIPNREEFYKLYIDFVRGYGENRDDTIGYAIYDALQLEWPNEEELKTIDGFVLTGSSANAYDKDPWIEKLKAHLVELDRQQVRVCGICFGHQVIAEALGGKVEKSKKGWELGQVEIKLSDAGTQFYHTLLNQSNPNKNNNTVGNGASSPIVQQQSKPIDSLQILQIHQDIVSKLPEGMEIMGDTGMTEIQGLIKKSSVSPNNTPLYHIVTFQGHPEFTPKHLTHLIEIEPDDFITPAQRQQAIQTITNNPDQPFMSSIINKFFNQPKN